MSNRRISSLGVAVVASLDPSSRDNMKQWVNLMGRSAEEIQAILAAYSTKTAKSLKDPLDNFAVHADKMIDRVAASLARTGNASDTHIANLRTIAQLAEQVGDEFLRWKSVETLNLAESLRLPQALTLAKELKHELEQVRAVASHNQGEQLKIQQQESLAADYMERHARAQLNAAEEREAKRRAADAGRRLDQQSNDPDAKLSPAARAVRDEERQAAENETLNRQQEQERYQDRLMRMADQQQQQQQDKEQEEARRRQEANDLSSERRRLQHEERKRQRQAENDDNFTLSGAPTRALSAVERDRMEQDAAERRRQAALLQLRHARSDAEGRTHIQTPTGSWWRLSQNEAEEKRSRIFEHARQDEARMARQQETTERILQRVRQQGGADPSFHFRDADHFMTAQQPSMAQRYGSRGMFGFSRHGAHSVRFASQNIGFGIDDAIQSYQYGGAAASIRAASNNATAIAGMLISSPVVAAATVVGISVATAALPIILNRFGWGTAFQNMTRTEKERLQQTNPNLYAQQQQIAGFFSASTREANTSKRWSTGEAAFLKAAGQGSFADLIGDKADQLTQQFVESGWLAQEQKRLEKENRRLRNMNSSDPTVAKALDKNTERIDAIKQERLAIKSNYLSDLEQLERFEEKRPELLRLNREKVEHNTETNNILRQGGFVSEEDYKERLRQQAKKSIQMAVLAAGGGSNNLAAQNAVRRIHVKLDEDLNDPNIGRMVALANIDAESDRRRFDQGLRPQNRTTQLRSQLNESLAGIRRQEVEGSMSPEEANRRRDALHLRHFTLGRRAEEDDIDDLNPERNPLRRLQRHADRTAQDIEGLQVDDATKRKLLLAHWKGTERSMEEALIPSGTRRYISQGYKIGSLEDEELRSRMVGNFGPPVKKEEKDSKTLEEIRDAIQALNDKLEIEAAKLGV